MFSLLLALLLIPLCYLALDFVYKAGYVRGEREGAVKMYRHLINEEPDEELVRRVIFFKEG